MSLEQKIKAFLKTEPRSASEVYDHLESAARTTLRPIVSRMVKAGSIYRPKLNLPNGDSILTINSEFRDPKLLSKLYKKSFYGRETLMLLLQHMQKYQPSLNRFEIAKVAALRIGAAPQFDWKETVDLIEGLEELGIVNQTEVAGEPYWTLNKKLFLDAGLQFSSTNLHQSFIAAKESIKLNLIDGLEKWMRMNRFVSQQSEFISANKVAVSFANLPFDFVGFCFANGVADRRKDSLTKPKEVVGDVMLEVCSLAYAKSFVSRLNEAQVIKGAPVIAFILARGFNKEAFRFLTEAGVLVWTTDQLFGQKAAQAISQTVEFFEDLVRKDVIDPKAFSKAFDGLENFKSLFGQIKGKLFEVMIAYFFTKRGCENVQIGRSVLNSDGGDGAAGKMDLDVFCTDKGGTVAYIIECKGIASDTEVDDEEVKKHFTRRTGQMRRQLASVPQNKIKKYKSIIITSGDFSAAAYAELKEKKFAVKEDVSLELWNRDKLTSELEEYDLNIIVEILDNHFEELPLE